MSVIEEIKSGLDQRNRQDLLQLNERIRVRRDELAGLYEQRHQLLNTIAGEIVTLLDLQPADALDDQIMDAIEQRKLEDSSSPLPTFADME